MSIYTVTAGLLVLHTLEEVIYSFWNTDYFSQSIASVLYTQPVTIYIIGQLVLYALVAVVLLKKSTQTWLLDVAIGLVLLFEVTHVVSAITLRTYTPGLLTGTLLLVVAIFFWAKLIKIQKII